MEFSIFDKTLWLVGFAGHLILLYVLVIRLRHRRFPVFTSLIAFEAVQTLALFFIAREGSIAVYRRVYWILAALDYCLQVSFICEIACHVLRPKGTWIRGVRRNLVVWCGLGTILTAATCLTVSQPSLMGPELWEMRIDLFTSVLTCELFASMCLVANRLRLLWGSHVMALGQGLTGWAAVACVGDAIHLMTGMHRALELADALRMVTYVIAVVLWIIALWFPERERIAAFPGDTQDILVALRKAML